MEKKVKQKKYFEELPFDCWSVITSFFTDHVTSLNVLRINKTMRKLSTLKTIVLFENVKFELRGDMFGKEFMDLYGDLEVPFVRILCVRKNNYFRNVNKTPLFSNDVKKNDETMRWVFRKFPKVRKFDFNWITISPSTLKNLTVTCRCLRFSGINCFSYDEKSKRLHHYLNEMNIQTLELESWFRSKEVISNLKLEKIKSLKTLILKKFGEMVYYSPYEIEIMGDSDYERGKLELKFESSELETLILEDYQFNTIDESMSRQSGIILKFPNLKRLEISFLHNPKKERSYFTNPSTFSQLQKLEHLVFSGSSFEIFEHQTLLDHLFKFENYFNIKYLDISYNSAFDGSMFPFLSKTLEVVIMKECQNINFKYVKCLENLKHLDCYHCNQVVEGGLSDEVLLSLNPEKMEFLAICRCHQVNISDQGFVHFKKLRYLSIMACSSKGITNGFIPIMFENNKNLKKLKLEHNITLIRRNSNLTQHQQEEYCIYFKKEKYEGKIERAEMKWKNNRVLARWIEVGNDENNKDKIFKCDSCDVVCFPDMCRQCCAFTCCFCDGNRRCSYCGMFGCQNCIEFNCVVHKRLWCSDRCEARGGEERIPTVKCEICRDQYCDDCIGIENITCPDRGVMEGCYLCQSCIDKCDNCKRVLSTPQMKERFDKLVNDGEIEIYDDDEKLEEEWFQEFRTRCSFCRTYGCVRCLPLEKCPGVGGNGCHYSGCEQCTKSCSELEERPCFTKCSCGCKLSLCDKCKKYHKDSKK